MRLWSLHPIHLDRAGLVALWREALLAQAVLAGKTKGYKNHPQLDRFKKLENPLQAIGDYLKFVQIEASTRGYAFNEGKIISTSSMPIMIPVTGGQISFEWEHLGSKLDMRCPTYKKKWLSGQPSTHPIFFLISGDVENWERS